MDVEQSAGVLEGSEAQQQETVMEIEVVSKADTPVEAAEPEKTPAADKESEQSAVNSEVGDTVGTEKAEKTEENMPKEDPKIKEGTSDKADLVAAEGKETENNQPEQDPVQEKPLAAQTDETLPEPATAQPLVEAQPPKEEEKVAEKIEAKAELKSTKDEVGEPEKKEEKPAEIVLASQDKKTEAVESKGDESGNVQTTEEVKEPEKSDTKEAEVTTTAAAAEVNASEPKEADTKQEEDPTPEVGSLAYYILDEKAKDVMRTTRTLVVLRGLPGSGKSFLARAIAAAYEDHCSIISADDHGVKPESSDSSTEYKALDEAIVARCSATTSPILVVVDDANLTQDRLARLRGIAKQHQLVVMFLEPRTEWSRDAAQLAKKTKRGLEQSKIEAMKASLDETSLPYFFGWFLFSTVQDKVKCTAMDFLKTLDTMEAFKKHLSDFTGKEEKEVDLEQYFKAKGTLHCTTKFTNYGKAEGAKEYADKQAVKDLYSSFTDLSLSALFVTPRTVGARVSLNEEQLLLWPDDAEKEAESVVPAAASLPRGSRAHITLGCAEGVQPVQTGNDLLEILALQKESPQGEEVEEMEPGTLTYFGEGRWYLALRQPICAPGCFSSVYKSKAPGQAKKEKKKPKCTIL